MQDQRPPRHTALRDLLAEARRIIDADDRSGALDLLLQIASRGERAASELPETVAHALVATARSEPDDTDRAALIAYRRVCLAREEIIALLQETQFGPDDIA